VRSTIEMDNYNTIQYNRNERKGPAFACYMLLLTSLAYGKMTVQNTP